MLPEMTERVREPEAMDAPGLDPSMHRRALDALATVNALSGTTGRVWKEVARLHRRTGRVVRVLDVACGGGDVPVAVARRARRHDLPVRVAGCDRSPVALARARALAERHAVDARFLALDVLDDALPSGFDLICCSLFLHHLSDDDAAALLASMRMTTEGSLLIQDLQRSRAGYVAAWAGLRLLTRSPVARADGPISVRAAFSEEELGRIATRAGLTGAEIRRAWPWRLVLRWDKP